MGGGFYVKSMIVILEQNILSFYRTLITSFVMRHTSTLIGELSLPHLKLHYYWYGTTYLINLFHDWLFIITNLLYPKRRTLL